MKEYDRQVFWLTYFDSELKRSEGRRVPLNSATRAPSLPELAEACRRLNIQPQPQPATFPALPGRESGYVSVVKSGAKHALLVRIAKELSTVRGMGQRRQPQQGQRKK